MRTRVPHSPWWQTAVIYQIYPRSFQDTDGDGVGDLRGITQRLDYLADLGVDAIWISPFYPSPMADFGYDVSNYVDVDPRFGTLKDFDALVAAAHTRNLKVILDFVPNHTSDQHPWFKEARASRTNSKRDWYIWRDQPNNWLANFGGGAWELDPQTEQYYYHAYLAAQPDLNWRNPELRTGMMDVLRFWRARGVDGFRVDVMWHLIKDAAFRDEPPNLAWRDGMDPYERLQHIYSTDQPEVHAIVAEMRRVIAPALLIGEIYLPLEKMVAYYGKNLDGAQLPFNFNLLSTPWTPAAIADLIRRYEALLPPGAWPNWVLGNHDRARLATRVGPEQARIGAMLLLTLRGTPTLYYGDELGLENVAIPPDRVQDPWEKNVPGLGLGRDPVRTPMPWDSGPNAGFSLGVPWLPLNPDHATRNVAMLSREPRTLLALYRALLALRRALPALNGGDIRVIDGGPDILAYERIAGHQRVIVALNFAGAPASLPLSGMLRLSTWLDRAGEAVGPSLTLHAHEGVVVEVAS